LLKILGNLGGFLTYFCAAKLVCFGLRPALEYPLGL
jgi:hypothetical protein